jgi:hypothetical protein
MRHHFTLTALAAVVCITSPLTAQSAQRWSIQASGLYVGVFGSAYDGLKSGPGAEVQGRYTAGLWSLGAGLQYSNHGLKEQSGSSIGLTGIFVEPRYVFDVGSSSYAPYVSARLAFLQQSAEINVAAARVQQPIQPGLNLQTSSGPTYSISASGFQGNVGGGVLVKLTPRVNLDLGVTLGLIRFGDAQLTNGTTTLAFPGTSGTGENAVVRVGVSIGLGGGSKRKDEPAPAPKPAAKPAIKR